MSSPEGWLRTHKQARLALKSNLLSGARLSGEPLCHERFQMGRVGLLPILGPRCFRGVRVPTLTLCFCSLS